MATAHTVVQFTGEQRLRVRAHLQEILDHTAFAGSRRRQAFLRYIVEETLAGRGHTIKETSLAVDVFERSSDFNAQGASIVRVTAGEIRRRLTQAYSSGLTSDIRIDLPIGSYQPTILFGVEAVKAAADKLAVVEEQAMIPAKRPWFRQPPVVSAVALLAVGAMALLALGLPARSTPLDGVWQPFVGHKNSVLISLAVPRALAISEQDKWLPLRAGESVPTSALREMDDATVGAGGALGAALFAEQLAFRKQKFVLKIGSDLSFADLKNSPAILLGGSRWTKELTRDLRYRMIDPDRWKIVDTKDPTKMWTVPAGSRDERSEGYSLITRLIRSDSDHPVLLVVGIDVRNTMAAVEFLSNPEKFELFASKAAAGWENKSFQVVLRNTIHGNSSGALSIAAMHVW